MAYDYPEELPEEERVPQSASSEDSCVKLARKWGMDFDKSEEFINANFRAKETLVLKWVRDLQFGDKSSFDALLNCEKELFEASKGTKLLSLSLVPRKKKLAVRYVDEISRLLRLVQNHALRASRIHGWDYSPLAAKIVSQKKAPRKKILGGSGSKGVVGRLSFGVYGRRQSGFGGAPGFGKKKPKKRL